MALFVLFFEILLHKCQERERERKKNRALVMKKDLTNYNHSGIKFYREFLSSKKMNNFELLNFELETKPKRKHNSTIN